MKLFHTAPDGNKNNFFFRYFSSRLADIGESPFASVLVLTKLLEPVFDMFYFCTTSTPNFDHNYCKFAADNCRNL